MDARSLAHDLRHFAGCHDPERRIAERFERWTGQDPLKLRLLENAVLRARHRATAESVIDAAQHEFRLVEATR